MMSDGVKFYSNCVVFVVDDNVQVCDSLESLIVSEFGCTVRSFQNPERCIEELGQLPHCVVSDYAMPQANGLEIQKQAANYGDLISFVFVSGKADFDVAITAMESGAVSFIRKPVVPAKLVEKLRTALDLSLASRAIASAKEEAKKALADLSEKEWQVLEMLLSGLLNKQVASRLDIGLRTVELRRQKIFEKTGCHSLAQVAQLIHKAGYLNN